MGIQSVSSKYASLDALSQDYVERNKLESLINYNARQPQRIASGVT